MDHDTQCRAIAETARMNMLQSIGATDRGSLLLNLGACLHYLWFSAKSCGCQGCQITMETYTKARLDVRAHVEKLAVEDLARGIAAGAGKPMHGQQTGNS